MRGLKAILGAAAVVAALAVVPTPRASAQVSFSINIGNPPACRWGYYDYPPYQCASYGYYGPGYFYNGIFLGVGPWHEWGYNHGWGGHRFASARGGHYVPNSHGDHRNDHPNVNHGGGHPGPAPHNDHGHPTPAPAHNDNHGGNNHASNNHGSDNHGGDNHGCHDDHH
jgi:hypothetical protein